MVTLANSFKDVLETVIKKERESMLWFGEKHDMFSYSSYSSRCLH